MMEAWARVFALFSRIGLSVAGQNYCGDLIFSGHTISITGLYLYINECKRTVVEAFDSRKQDVMVRFGWQLCTMCISLKLFFASSYH